MANFVIDKSRFNDEQLAQYEALVAIGKIPCGKPVPERQPVCQEILNNEYPQIEKLRKIQYSLLIIQGILLVIIGILWLIIAISGKTFS